LEWTGIEEVDGFCKLICLILYFPAMFEYPVQLVAVIHNNIEFQPPLNPIKEEEYIKGPSN
jgi:hypothetical protein